MTPKLILHPATDANNDMLRFTLFDHANEIWIVGARLWCRSFFHPHPTLALRERWRACAGAGRDVGQGLPLAGADCFGRQECLPYKIPRRDIAIVGRNR